MKDLLLHENQSSISQGTLLKHELINNSVCSFESLSLINESNFINKEQNLPYEINSKRVPKLISANLSKNKTLHIQKNQFLKSVPKSAVLSKINKSQSLNQSLSHRTNTNQQISINSYNKFKNLKQNSILNHQQYTNNSKLKHQTSSTDTLVLNSCPGGELCKNKSTINTLSKQIEILKKEVLNHEVMNKVILKNYDLSLIKYKSLFKINQKLSNELKLKSTQLEQIKDIEDVSTKLDAIIISNFLFIFASFNRILLIGSKSLSFKSM